MASKEKMESSAINFFIQQKNANNKRKVEIQKADSAKEMNERKELKRNRTIWVDNHITEFKNESYNSFLKTDNAEFVSTTKDDPRAELRYVRKRSRMEFQFSRVPNYFEENEYARTLLEQVKKHHLYRDFLKPFELQENEFGWSNNPKRELELWDRWYFELTGQEWNCMSIVGTFD